MNAATIAYYNNANIMKGGKVLGSEEDKVRCSITMYRVCEIVIRSRGNILTTALFLC